MTTSTRPWRSSAPRRWGRPSPNSSPCRPTPITWSTGCRRPTPRCSSPERPLSVRRRYCILCNTAFGVCEDVGGSAALDRLGMLGRPGLAVGFGVELIGDCPVDGLADDVGMSGMAGDLGGQVPQDPADGHDEIRGLPRIARITDLGAQADPAVLDDPMGDLDLCHRLVEDRHYVLERPVGNGGAIEHSVESELGVDRREVREFD